MIQGYCGFLIGLIFGVFVVLHVQRKDRREIIRIYDESVKEAQEDFSQNLIIRRESRSVFPTICPAPEPPPRAEELGVNPGTPWGI